MIRIPVYQPLLQGNEKKYVLECLRSTWISSKGKFIGEFEQAFAAYLSLGHAAAVCNGTVALHLALLALGVGLGDEVIVPSFTYVASVNAIAYTGARPVFADSRPDTWQMDAADVRARINARTRAVMAVHLFGHPCDLDALTALVQEHKLFLVEDCAEAIGSRYHGQHVGGFGHIAAFSFFGNKTITTGEGGMVVTGDPLLHERVVHLKGQGLARNREYWHDILGYNYRMTNICAAIGLAQLERVEEHVRLKRRLAGWYDRELRALPLERHGQFGDVLHSYWMYTILVSRPELREPLRACLARAGIETRPAFYPVHNMPMYAAANRSLPVAESLSSRGIMLPSWPGLKRSDVRFIAGKIQQGLQEIDHGG